MFLTIIEGSMEVELMVTKRDDDDDDRVNIGQSAFGRWNGRVLQKASMSEYLHSSFLHVSGMRSANCEMCCEQIQGLRCHPTAQQGGSRVCY